MCSDSLVTWGICGEGKIIGFFPPPTEFVMGLAQFAVRDEDSEKKLEFLFRIYDMDRDGFISNGELFQVSLSHECGSHNSSTAL